MMLAPRPFLLVVGACLALCGVHASPSAQQRPFMFQDVSAASASSSSSSSTDARLARLTQLTSDDDSVAVSYPIDAQRLSRLTPRPMPGYYARMARKHQRQLDEYRSRKHLEHLDQQRTDTPAPRSWLARLARLVEPSATPSKRSDEHNIYEPAYLTQPLDHFDNTTAATFQQKYYYSLRHYVPASQRPKGEAVPIFILDSGEASLEARLPFLETGIIDILANATGGIGIILEHRYYGTSYPNRTELGPGDVWGTDELRWLTNRQALEDSAEFIRRLRINGTDDDEPRKVIYYGGSYPGARAAHMRLLYPELVHGAIASSAVVAAIDEFPEYFYTVARGAETQCSQAIQAAVAGIDAILAPDAHAGSHQKHRNATETELLLDLFELDGLSEPADLANLLTAPLGAFQSQNWDANVTSTEFDDFCHVLTTYGASGFGASSKSQRLIARGLEVSREVHAYAKYIRSNYVLPCLNDEEGGGGGGGDNGNPLTGGSAAQPSKADECFGSQDVSSFVNATELNAGKAWTYQYCTTWGYIMTAPRVPTWTKEGRPVLSGPKVVSTLLDYDYVHDICKRGFPKGRVNSVPPRPNVDEVNKLGGFELAVDRLAFVDGQFDPWRPASVHSEEFAYGGARADTVTRPFKLIADCWHHCDENGVKDGAKTPERVRKIHEQQVGFVKEWLKV
ncbi:Serine carboxypeptidase [Thecaphora frezii]|nr:putative peptidase s28 [Thecaphora frezii]